MQGSKALVEILQLLLLLELSGQLDKRVRAREGQGLLFLAAGKCTGRDGAVICSGVLTGADDLLFKTVGEVKTSILKVI